MESYFDMDTEVVERLPRPRIMKEVTENVVNYIRYLTNLGFERAARFKGSRVVEVNGEKIEVPEYVYVFAHREKGIVNIFHTYKKIYSDGSGDGRHSVNSGMLCYAWNKNTSKYVPGLFSSGSHTAEGILYGYHDSRCDIEQIIQNFESCGSFISVWPENENNDVPFDLRKWGDDYAKYGREDFADIKAMRKVVNERYLKLPLWVRNIMNCKILEV